MKPSAAGLVVPDLLAHPARRYGGQICVALGEEELTYAEVSERAARLAGHLLARGIQPGQRVALLALNELEYVEIRAGATRARVTLVPLNWRLAPAELAAIVEDCEPVLLIVGPGFEETARGLSVPALMSLADAEGMESYTQALAETTPQPVPAGLLPEDVAIISYTSGTTGQPKGVMKSNRATWFELMSMAQEWRARSDSVYVACMPMFHISCNVGLALVMVGGVHLQTRRFEPDEFLDLVDRRGVTHAQLVPTMIQSVLERWGDRPPTLQSIMYGGSAMPADVARRAMELWPGCRLINTFGLTEAMGVAMLSPEEHDPDGAPERLRSVGRSAPFMTWRVVDDSDRDLPVGAIGEVVVAGPNLLSGYWNNEEATTEALRGGWFHTGDLGRRDEDGYLFLVDRRNDRIVTGGENVYPSEVERVIRRHPAVADAAVFGVPDDRWGEAVCAAVVAAPGAAPTGAELIDHCRPLLAGYKMPKQVRFQPELPRSPTGKVLRRTLRDAWQTDGGDDADLT